jgi:hypothetical protein
MASNSTAIWGKSQCLKPSEDRKGYDVYCGLLLAQMSQIKGPLQVCLPILPELIILAGFDQCDGHDQ